MASCNNCQNLLPRTVDRCPVCGVPQVPESAEVEETPIPASPGWASDTSGDDGIETSAPAIPAYTPVNAPNDLDDVPTATPIAAVEDDARIVRAASNRVEGNFMLGKKPKHGITVIAAGALALSCVLGGAAAGSRIPLPTDTLAYNDETRATGDDLDEEAVAAWSDAYGDAFVSVELSGCGAGLPNAQGIALDPRIVLVDASGVETDTRPTIIAQDGTRYEGQTVGVLGTTGIAVVRLSDALPTHFSWGPMLNVTENMNVRVASFSNGTASVENGTITRLRRNSAGVVGMDVEPETQRGSVVIDENNLVIGVISRNGTFAADSDELSPRVSNAVLIPSDVEPVCPVAEAVPGEDGTDTGEPAEGTDG